MIEQVYKMTLGNTKTVERIIQDENIHYAHMIFSSFDSVPEHTTNSNVYMTVIRGTLSIELGDQEANCYEVGSILKIPNNTKMKISNPKDETLELIVVKAPAPML